MHLRRRLTRDSTTRQASRNSPASPTRWSATRPSLRKWRTASWPSWATASSSRTTSTTVAEAGATRPCSGRGLRSWGLTKSSPARSKFRRRSRGAHLMGAAQHAPHPASGCQLAYIRSAHFNGGRWRPIPLPARDVTASAYDSASVMPRGFDLASRRGFCPLAWPHTAPYRQRRPTGEKLCCGAELWSHLRC